MIRSKIILSPPQLELATNGEVILTKNAIIEQVEIWLGELASRYRELSKPYEAANPEVFTLHPKISKGEKQEGMPWVMLDYPRRFSLPQGCFAIRTMFWWGRYLSVRALLSGTWLSAVPKLESEFQHDVRGFTLHPFDVDIDRMRFAPEGCSTRGIHYVVARKLPIASIDEATTTFEGWTKQLLHSIFET